GLVPLAVVAAHLPKTVALVARRKAPLTRLVLPVADASFILAPALVFLIVAPDGVWAALATTALAFVALMASDIAISSLRMKVGLGVARRPGLRGLAGVSLAGGCLAPVRFLAALAGAPPPALLALVLPLAGLLVIFSRERGMRIDTALELQRAERTS